VGADHLSFFRLGPGTPPALVGAESRIGRVAADAGRRYVQSLYYRFDPNTRRVETGDGSTDGPLVTRLHAADIPDASYRSEIYERFGLEDRLSILGHAGPVWHIVSLYRDRATGRFSPAEEAALASRAPLVSQLAARQIASRATADWVAPTLPPVTHLEAMVRALGAGLSERETQVCARALLGKTGEGIALDLDVKETTVATLRKRAYGKLAISTLNELFALCLSRDHDMHGAAP
jgi:DNA-binding CsgD family transcriptional regulator